MRRLIAPVAGTFATVAVADGAATLKKSNGHTTGRNQMTTRFHLAALLTILSAPVLAVGQVPNVDAAKAQAATAKSDASATAAAAKQDASVKADAAKKDASAKADATKQDATTQATGVADKAKTKAKATGKSGVDKGTKKAATKVKTAVGEDKGVVVETVAKEKGNAGVDKGVDKAAGKVESKLK